MKNYFESKETVLPFNKEQIMILGNHGEIKYRRCPKCNRELNHIEYQKEAIEYGKICYIPDDDMKISDIELVMTSVEWKDGSIEDIYSCPYCDTLLTTDIDEAKEFMLIKETGPQLAKVFEDVIKNTFGERK